MVPGGRAQGRDDRVLQRGGLRGSNDRWAISWADQSYQISGFFILRPASMYIWNTIRKWFQERIEDMGVEETSFPMFLSAKSLEKEKGQQSKPRSLVRGPCSLTYLKITSRALLPNSLGSPRRKLGLHSLLPLGPVC